MTTPNDILTKVLVSTDGLIDGNISGEYLEKAIDNDVLLSRINTEVAQTVKFEKPILKTFLSVEDGQENTLPVTSVVPVFITQAATFEKVETETSLTNEIIQDSKIDIEASIKSQIAMQQAVKLQFNALNSPVFGITNALIDRANSFAEAEKPDGVRHDDIFNIQYSYIAGEVGGDSQEINDFIISLIKDVPSRYQNDITIYMSKAVWFDKIVSKFDAQAAKDVLVQDSSALTFKGYPVVILDNCPDDVIFLGDLSNAFEFVPLANSSEYLIEPQTVKGQQTIYEFMRYSFIPLDNTAIRVGVLALDPTP